MSYKELVLFVSSTSQKCMPLLQFIESLELDVTIVRLDTKETREQARGGPYPINEVPTLFVMYNNSDELAIYTGLRVMPMLTTYLKHIQQQQLTLNPTPIPPQQHSKTGLYGKQGSKAAFQPEPQEDEDSSIIEPEEPVTKPRIGGKKKKKKRQSQVEQEEDLIFVQDDKPPRQSMKGLMMNTTKNNSTKMKSTLQKAEEMKAEWERMMKHKEH